MEAFLLTSDPPASFSDKPGSSQAGRIAVFLPDIVLRLTECLQDGYS